MRKHGRGVSLIEVLVALGLLSLIMTLLVQILLPGLQAWKHARAVADIEQQCLVVEERITRTVMASIGGSIQSANNSTLQAISMLGHGGTEAEAGYDSTTGNPDWEQVDIFYVRASDQILYQTFWNENPGPALPHEFHEGTFQLTDPQLLGLCGMTQQSERRLAEKVTTLRLTPASEESSPVESEGYILRLSLTTNVPTGTRSIDREVFIIPRLRERQV